VAVEVTTCRGRGHIVTGPVQATQLVKYNIHFARSVDIRLYVNKAHVVTFSLLEQKEVLS